MLYFTVIFIIVVITLLILNLRVRLSLGKNHRLLFLSLGHSGSQLDFVNKKAEIRLWGIKIITINLAKKLKEITLSEVIPKAGEKPKKPGRKRSIVDFISILPECLKALWKYFVGLLKEAVIEEMEGQIEGGFDSPGLTGTVFGFYQAMLAVNPQTAGRLNFIPDWYGRSFSGSLKLAVAMPFYKFIYITLKLIIKLPLRDLIKLAIGKKKGASDGK